MKHTFKTLTNAGMFTSAPSLLIKKIKNVRMKQKFFLSLLAIGFTVLSASATPDPERLVLTVGNVEHLNIQDNIDVVLVQGAPDDNVIIMDQNASDKLNVRLSNKKLVLAAQNHLSKKQKITVYVYVNKLKTITVDGDSQVKTEGSLKSEKLDVFIGGYAQVHLRTNGQIKAYALDDSEIIIKYLSGMPLAKRA
ncbi:MAG TPA: DUF2807 domain-containing protein, partial [Chitinophagaceae bacterium]|nr:DUF2807 domain-containing protein [Chitinophagaceae bacterium]